MTTRVTIINQGDGPIYVAEEEYELPFNQVETSNLVDEHTIPAGNAMEFEVWVNRSKVGASGRRIVVEEE